MKNKQLRLRMSDRRFNKLQLYAAHADKTMTQVVEELLDTLPDIEKENYMASAHDAARAVNPSA